MRVRKAVFPVAGLGTRFLPATKAIPKELAPVVDKPVLQYAVEEARAAGIEQMIFVSSLGKGALENHFDRAPELERALEAKGKTAFLEAVRASALADGEMIVVRQHAPLGLGHAVWCARHAVGDEPFAVLLPDELLLSDPPCLAQMTRLYDARAAIEAGGGGPALIATREVPRALTKRYGVLDPAGPEDDDGLTPAQGFIEKPAPEDAPSTASVIGRYILPPTVFEHLSRGERGAGGEIQLTDAIDRLIGAGAVYGVRYDGDRYDCGAVDGFVEANVACALARPELAPQLRETLRRLLGEP